MNKNPMNAFTPSSEITDIHRFAGRQKELEKLSIALQTEGAQIVIFGDRGIGKSSLARILENLARNDTDIIARLPQPPFQRFEYDVIFFTCEDSIEDIPTLLARLLNTTFLGSWVPAKATEEKKSKIGSGQATLLGLGLTGKYETSETSKFYDAPTDVHSAFTGAVTRYRNASQPRSGLVIIIDEFDRIHNRKGIASLLKSLGPIGVKFVFVGVASTISELVKDHESVARQLTDGSIAVPPMSDNEADAIFDNAQEYLDHKYSWPMATRDWIRKVARGHPFYIHLLGKHSLLEAIREKSTEVSVILAQHALERIANNESAPVQEEAYKKAIRHSYPRELILKQFANEEQSEIYTSHVYPKISEIAPNLDTSKISVYVGQLTLKEYGAPLVKLRDRYYRFSDSLFKAYAAARPSQRKPAERDPDETED